MCLEINSVELELRCVPERRNRDGFGLVVALGQYRVALSVSMGIIERGIKLKKKKPLVMKKNEAYLDSEKMLQ